MSSALSTAVLSDNLLSYASGSIAISHTELNLKQTLLGGQSFRWFEQAPNELIGVLDVYIIRLQHVNACLNYEFYVNISHENLHKSFDDRQNETKSILNNYFQLSIKLEELFKRWSNVDERFRKKLIPIGIRVLAQDPFENLLSFICSSNNNVQRITKMVNCLCEKYGKIIGTLNGITYHQFPTIDELDQKNLEENLRQASFGYRARYIHKTIEYLKYTINDSTYFSRLKTLSVGEARKELLKIMGVGRKVADCVLLMSFDKQDVVPVDTHIHSIALTYYGQKKSQLTGKNYDEIASFFEQLWKPYAGWAQAAAFSNELRWPMESSEVSRKRKTVKHCRNTLECQFVKCKKKFSSLKDERKEC